MNMWKCLIIDDEPVAIRIIKRYLDNMGRYEISGTFTRSMEAMQWLRTHHGQVDLMFLDIKMPELNGLELFKTLEDPPELILITAHRNYAVEAFELQALDYLMKPIPFPRFVKALDRFEELKAATEILSENEVPGFLFVTVDRKKKKILIPDIRYVESLRDYIRIVTDQGNMITKETTADFEQRLPDSQFMRIHRSFIVPIARIQSYSHKQVIIGDKKLPIGRSYKKEVKAKLGIS